MVCNKTVQLKVRVQLINVLGTGVEIKDYPSDAEVFARIRRASLLFEQYANITFTILQTKTFTERSQNSGSEDCGSLCCIQGNNRCKPVLLTKDRRNLFYEKRLFPFVISKDPKVITLVNTGLEISEGGVGALTQTVGGKKVIWFSPIAVKFFNDPLEKTKEHPYVIAHELGHALGVSNHSTIKTNLMFKNDDAFRYKDNQGGRITTPIISDTQCMLFRKSPYTSTT